MKHNENYQHMAREVMRKRLASLDAKAADNCGPRLSVQESTERAQLQELLSQLWRDCPECLGVGRVRFAYTAVMTRYGYMIGRADEDQPGYTLQDAFGTSPTLDLAKVRAKRLNHDLGLDEKEAYCIVISSMRPENIREQNSQKERA
jgi:hypothetical protein